MSQRQADAPDRPDGDAAPRPDRRKGDRRRSVVRIAAVGDFHSAEDSVGAYREQFERVNDEADILLLAGDLTNWGTPAEMKVAVAERAGAVQMEALNSFP